MCILRVIEILSYWGMRAPHGNPIMPPPISLFKTKRLKNYICFLISKNPFLHHEENATVTFTSYGLKNIYISWIFGKISDFYFYFFKCFLVFV